MKITKKSSFIPSIISVKLSQRHIYSEINAFNQSTVCTALEGHLQMNSESGRKRGVLTKS